MNGLARWSLMAGYAGLVLFGDSIGLMAWGRWDMVG